MTNVTKTANEYFLTQAQFDARKQAGTLEVGAIYHITDVNFVPKTATVTTGSMAGVYGYDGQGNTYKIQIGENAYGGGTIVKRTQTGTIRTATPTNDNDATPKSYVDDAIAGAGGVTVIDTESSTSTLVTGDKIPSMNYANFNLVRSSLSAGKIVLIKASGASDSKPVLVTGQGYDDSRYRVYGVTSNYIVKYSNYPGSQIVGADAAYGCSITIDQTQTIDSIVVPSIAKATIRQIMGMRADVRNGYNIFGYRRSYIEDGRQVLELNAADNSIVKYTVSGSTVTTTVEKLATIAEASIEVIGYGR